VNRDEFGRIVGSAGNPLKALARARVRQHRADRQAAKAAGVSLKRASAERVKAALNKAFDQLQTRVRGR
jgi:hypothetical protein